MVYAQSIEESKNGKRSWDAKMGRNDEQVQPNLQKRAPNKDIF